MSELDSKDRADLSDSDYAFVDKNGDRKLPIPDEKHVRNAIARFGQTDFEGNSDGKRKAAEKILAAAKKHGMDVGDDDDVKKAAS
jgi:uncharacterized protein DUF6582